MTIFPITTNVFATSGDAIDVTVDDLELIISPGVTVATEQTTGGPVFGVVSTHANTFLFNSGSVYNAHSSDYSVALTGQDSSVNNTATGLIFCMGSGIAE